MQFQVSPVQSAKPSLPVTSFSAPCPKSSVKSTTEKQSCITIKSIKTQTLGPGRLGSRSGLYPTHRTLGAAGTITPSEAFGQVPVFASGGKERNGLFTLQTRLTSDRFSPADAHRQWTTGQRADQGPTQGPPSAPRAWPGLERTLIPQTLSEEL